MDPGAPRARGRGRDRRHYRFATARIFGHAHSERVRDVDPDARHPRFPGRIRSASQARRSRTGHPSAQPYGRAAIGFAPMGADHDAVRARLGRVGVWTFAFDALRAADVRDAAAAIETLGYPALWVPEGGSSREIFAHLSLLLAATRDITVCSGIANVTARHPEAMAGGARTLADAYGERVVLGIGIGHQTRPGGDGRSGRIPIGRMAAYLDEMDAARMGPDPDVPVRRLIAALGPRMLEVAASRGPRRPHVLRPRRAHGEGPRAPRARAGARRRADRHRVDRSRGGPRDRPTLGGRLPVAPELREQLAHGWATRMTSARAGVTASSTQRSHGGTCPRSRARVREHLDAGADHVCVQVISGRDDDVCLPALRELGDALL